MVCGLKLRAFSPTAGLACARAALLALPLLVATLGCRNAQPAVLPPPGGALNRPDVYYTPPAVGALPANASSNSVGTNTRVSLEPNSSGRRNTSGDTFDVASRVAADAQPIRVLDSTNRPNFSANTSLARGMPLNDATNASSWRGGVGTAVPPSNDPWNHPATSISSNPFGGLRGTAIENRATTSQSFSSQDGQWRSRSSYEATERR